MKKVLTLLIYFYSSFVFATTDLPVTIAGQTYQVELTENTFLASRTVAQFGRDVGSHYYGSISSVPDSWVRVSNINGLWKGLASVYGSLYVISQAEMETFVGAQAASIASPATAASEFASDMGSCGVAAHSAVGKQMAGMSMLAEMESGVVAEAMFSDFCSASDQVNGVCILPQIDFIFDTQFQALYGSSAMAEAMSIVNIAEGFFSQDRAEMDGNNGMNMAFDSTIQLPTSDVFSTSTDAGTFLGDIRTKNANSQIPGLTPGLGLVHVVTGRDFDGTTAGIAFVDAICDSNGFGVGTTSVVGSSTLTAVVMAHELGHNFGSFHDGDSGSSAIAGMCGTGTHIMSPSVSSGFTGFSSCSVTQMVNAIEALPSLEQCFNFPLDVTVADPVAPTNTDVGDNFNISYSLQIGDGGSQSVTNITMTGTSSQGARFTSVTVNGNACSISSNNNFPDTRYDCSINISANSIVPAGASAASTVVVNIDAQATGWEAQANIMHTVSADNANVVMMGGDNLTTNLNVSGEITDPPPGIGPSNSGGGGGGGGSLGWPIILALGGLLLRRRTSC